MKNNKLYTVRTDPTFNQIIVEKGKYNPNNAHMTLKGTHLQSSGIYKSKYERDDIFKSNSFCLINFVLNKAASVG
jgi:hypothetical protein